MSLGKDFMNAPWLFAEAYKYRRLHEAFSVSRHWRDYDVFYRQKVGSETMNSASLTTRILVRHILSFCRCCI